MVYLILFFMGISLAFLDNPASSLLAIPHYSVINITTILLCNVAAPVWLERGLSWHSHHHQEEPPPRIAMALELLKLRGVVATGFAIGLSGLTFLQHAIEASEYTLVLLFFLINARLRNNDTILRQVILNRQGMIVIVVMVTSSSVGGLISAFILDLPIDTALVVASSFGWYSLSGILLIESSGPVIGSAVFFSNLARELVAIILIPRLIRHSRSAILGLCGATSMDLIPPVLQRTGGLDMVPVAIVHSFILSLLVPILIAFFSAQHLSDGGSLPPKLRQINLP